MSVGGGGLTIDIRIWPTQVQFEAVIKVSVTIDARRNRTGNANRKSI